MKTSKSKQKSNSAVFDCEAALIRDLLDNLELEHALTWLMEAIGRQTPGTDEEPWHLYQTTLFSLYVDYGSKTVRLSAALACHDADMEIPLREFLEVLKSEASHETEPRHFSAAETDRHIHPYLNPYLKKRHGKRSEPDSGFYL